MFIPYMKGMPVIVEKTITLTVLQSDYSVSKNITSIEGIKHTKGWFGRESFYEIEVKGFYFLEEGITYYLRVQTTSQKDLDEPLVELILAVKRVW